MRVLLTFLAALLLSAPLTAQAELRVVATDCEWVAPLSQTEALLLSMEGELSRVDLSTGESLPWQPSWAPADGGWDQGGPYFDITVSPDGNWVYLLRWVLITDEVDVVNMQFGPPGVVAVILCKPDGREARCVALSQSVGGGPQVDFTTDSARLVGQPLLRCEPERAAYVEFSSALWEVPPIERYNYIEAATGERGWAGEIDISDGYYKCPYSDYFIAGSEGEQPFGHFLTGMVEGDYSALQTEWGWSYSATWVLPNAVLYEDEERYGLLYVDGSKRKLEGPRYQPHCWLSDGTYIYADSIGQVSHGTLDWRTNEVSWSRELPWLTGWGFSFLVPLPDASGVLIGDDDGLLYLLSL